MAETRGNDGPLAARDKSRIWGFVCGAILGAIVCRSHGLSVEVAGTIGVGIVGFIAGPWVAMAGIVVWAFVRISAKIYWEVLTGRRKLPSVRDGTTAHRKRMLGLLGAIFIVSGAIWVGLYFRASDAERPRVLRFAELCFGACLVLVMAMVTIWWRNPARKKRISGNGSEEFSANFDSDMVRPFLERIRPYVDSGFGSDEVERVCQIVATLPHDRERAITFQIRHAGKEAELKVQVFMDDVDAPDIYFFGPSGLNKEIESEFGRFAEERGI